ncbi:uracil-DNA glycosylase [Bacillus phage SP-15]|uniref:Uracil-DNA glycosylase n=1 Tax=Bacillus phage SP-15 TaxID=1792032 RepID=A0A127AW33_9CAUD|nr:uracil-DNA glycosylase [Bacillus phage SP-15]AMM44899.1 uracil-DNA glycosylase [Bacillus phage SP-15]
MNCSELCKGKTIVYPRGTENPIFYVVGEAPGFTENKVGKPFVGRSGKLLEKLMSEVGLDETNTRISSVLPCIPLNDKGVIRPPSQEEADHCSGILVNDLIKTKPKVIIALGATAARFFIRGNFTKISRVRGMIYGVKIKDMTALVVPTYHPAYLLRRKSEDTNKLVIEDFQVALNLVDNKRGEHHETKSTNA